MGTGRVDWHLDPPTGSVHNVSAMPLSGETPEAYFYDTPFGNFTFPKATPHRMRLLAATGVAVDAAWFDASIARSVEGTSEVVSRDATTFVAVHQLLVDGTAVAEIRTTFEFFPNRSPKISAALTPLVKLDSPQLVWMVLTKDRAAEFGNTKISDLDNVTDLVLVDDPDLQIDVGTPAMLDGDQPTMSVNWSDAPLGTVTLAGRIQSRIGNQSGVIVYFPSGVTEVDPTVFATSTSPTATGYSSQRKVIWDGEKYWVFYDAGGSTGISYRTTPDGITWTPARTVGTGAISKGFDVDARGPAVALAWYDNGYSLMFRKGTFYTDIVAWDATRTLWTATSNPPAPSVAIAMDGSYWVAGHRVFRSPDSVNWSDITTTAWTGQLSDPSVSAPTSVTFLLPLSGTRGSASLLGWVYAILNIHRPFSGLEKLLVDLYNATSGTWNEKFLQIAEADETRNETISTIITGSVVQLLYTAGFNVIQTQIGFVGSGFDFDRGYETYIAQSEAAPRYPSITVGPPGKLYAFWRSKPQTEWVIRNSTGDGLVWSNPSSLFPVTPGQSPTFLSAPKMLFNRAVVIWRDVAGSCTTCNLAFGAVPILDDFGASSSHPWARAGLSVGDPLIGELSDAVNPASGQLVVRQTAAQAPGRGLGLSLAYIHATPPAFQSGTPMFFATNPTVPMGTGWEIDLPWIADPYMHMGGGQRYVMFVGTAKFENHVGTPFTLYDNLRPPCAGGYDLYLADGTRLNFTLSSGCTWAKLNYILDVTGQNRINFTYASDKLSSIVDTLGRVATFAYYASGTFAGKLQSLSYAGRTVTFDYALRPSGATVLLRVTYPLNLQTTFTYDPSGWGTPASDYLIGGVTQAWGASTSYLYASAPVGTEATGYFVTRQDIKDNGVTVRSRTFNYATVNGWAMSTTVAVGDGSVTKGYEVLGLASASRGMTVILKDASASQLSKTVSWYYANGSLGAADVYLGEATNRNYTNVVASDNWGNPYYSLTALSPTASHETFASYGNSDSQNAFRAPANLRMTTDGKIRAENFDRADLSRWILSTTAATIGLNNTVWNHAPPSMQFVVATGGSASAYQSFPSQSGTFLVTTSVRLNETNKDHKLSLRQTLTTRAELTFAADGNVKWLSQGGAYVTLRTYAKDTWYRVSLEVDVALNSATIAINEYRSASQTVYSAGTVDTIRFEVPSGPAAMFVGDYGIARKNAGGTNAYLAFRVTGLVPNRKVEFFDLTDVLVGASVTADGSGNADLTSRAQLLPVGYVKVYDASGKEEYRSPFREFWPGSVYQYTAPYTYPNGKFYTNTLPTDVHKALLGTLQWQNGRGAQFPVVEESYAKYLANGLLNATKAYHEGAPLETSYSRDAFGNIVLIKDVQGKVVRYEYGPAYSNAWLTRERQALPSGEIRTRSTYDFLTGLQNSTTNPRGFINRVSYDALGRPLEVRSFDAEPSTEVLFYDMETPTVDPIPGQEDLSGKGNHGTFLGTSLVGGKVDRARAFDGVDDRISASDSASLSITSSLTIAGWVRYDSLGTGSSTRVIVRKYDAATNKGYALEVYEAGAGANAKKLRLLIGSGSLNSYVSTGTLANAGTWYHVAAVYSDPSDTVTFYINGVQSGLSTGVTVRPSATTASLAVGRRYESATQVWSGTLDEIRVFNAALLAVDVVALTNLAFQLYSTQTITYDDALRRVTRQDQDGRQVRTTFDSLGCMTKVERLYTNGSTYSTETFVYNWQDARASYTSPMSNTSTWAYDGLGRPLSSTNPDGKMSYVTYVDLAACRKMTDPDGHSRAYYADYAGRTTRVDELYPGSTTTTMYSYDEVGNLVSVKNALNQTTYHTYNDLNRFAQTVYPDSKNDYFTYYDAGSLKTKKTRDGSLTTYNYDDVYRPTSVDYPGGTADDVTYAYDSNGNPTWVNNSVAQVVGTYDLKDRALTERERFLGPGEPDVTSTLTYSKAGDLSTLSYPGTAFTLSYEMDEFHRTKRAYNGGTNYGQFTYLKDDAVQDLTFANGLKTTLTYDKVSRPTKIRTFDGATEKWSFLDTYDDAGNVATLSGLGIGSQTFSYDAQDRLTKSTGTGWGDLSYFYDAVGNRKRVDVDAPGSVTLRPMGPGSSTQWTKFGCTANWDCVDDATPDGDTTHVETGTPGYTDLYAMQDLGQSGSVLSVTVTANAWGEPNQFCQAELDGCYSYLKLRVNGYDSAAFPLTTPTVSATWTTNPATGQPWTPAEVNALEAGFRVDRASEITKVTQLYMSVELGSTSLYAYNDGLTGINNLTSISGAESVTFTYTTNGEVLTRTEAGVTWTYSYNGRGLLKEVKQGVPVVATYSYDGLGRRVKAVENGVTTFFVYGLGIDPIYEKTGTTETRHIYANGMRIARQVVGGATYYYHADALGSTWRITDASKNIVLSTSYEPFGRSWGTTGSLASTERYRFLGERNDTESGLVYLRARQYDPKVGRFVAADPVLGHLRAPQTQNRYAYAVNNPGRFSDPTGLDCSINPVTWGNCLAGAWDWVYSGDFLENYHAPGELPTSCNSGGCSNPSNNAANQWRSLDPSIRKGIMVVTLVVILTILTAGAIDVIGAYALGGEAIGLAGAAAADDAAAATEYTPDAFRSNLADFTGEDPFGFDAHHIFPQQFRDLFERMGFAGEDSIDNPMYGTWWESGSHRALSTLYNQYWADFLDYSPSMEDALGFGRVLSEIFGFAIYY